MTPTNLDLPANFDLITAKNSILMEVRRHPSGKTHGVYSRAWSELRWLSRDEAVAHLGGPLVLLRETVLQGLSLPVEVVVRYRMLYRITSADLRRSADLLAEAAQAQMQDRKTR